MVSNNSFVKLFLTMRAFCLAFPIDDRTEEGFVLSLKVKLITADLLITPYFKRKEFLLPATFKIESQ